MEKHKKVKTNLKEARKNMADYKKESRKDWKKLNSSISKEAKSNLKELRNTF